MFSIACLVNCEQFVFVVVMSRLLLYLTPLSSYLAGVSVTAKLDIALLLGIRPNRAIKLGSCLSTMI